MSFKTLESLTKRLGAIINMLVHFVSLMFHKAKFTENVLSTFSCVKLETFCTCFNPL